MAFFDVLAMNRRGAGIDNRPARDIPPGQQPDSQPKLADLDVGVPASGPGHIPAEPLAVAFRACLPCPRRPRLSPLPARPDDARPGNAFSLAKLPFYSGTLGSDLPPPPPEGFTTMVLG